MNDKQTILQIVDTLIRAVKPDQLISKHLSCDADNIYICSKPISRKLINRLNVIAVGKAAAAMAKEVEIILANQITAGLCITKYGHSIPLQYFNTIEAGHPLPDEMSVVAAASVLEMVKGLSPNDVILVLISGGASSLVTDVPPSSSLKEIQQLFQLLINSGASINEINIVRKHLSKLKGGQLAHAARPAKVFTLLISDVPGNDISVIGSGPTSPDQSLFYDACNVLLKYDLWKQAGKGIKEHILNGMSDKIMETPKPGDLLFANTFSKIIGSNTIALQAAKQMAIQAGYHTQVLHDNITGDTEKAARDFVKHIIHFDGKSPTCFLMGGETTLKVTGNGKGGRNQHFVLCALYELLQHVKEQEKRITILSVGTDGTDGPTDAAGAIIDNSILDAVLLDKMDLEDSLRNFDAYHFFDKYGGLIKTGPTHTNVMDIMAGFVT